MLFHRSYSYLLAIMIYIMIFMKVHLVHVTVFDTFVRATSSSSVTRATISSLLAFARAARFLDKHKQ